MLDMPFYCQWCGREQDSDKDCEDDKHLVKGCKYADCTVTYEHHHITRRSVCRCLSGKCKM